MLLMVLNGSDVPELKKNTIKQLLNECRMFLVVSLKVVCCKVTKLTKLNIFTRNLPTLESLMYLRILRKL